MRAATWLWFGGVLLAACSGNDADEDGFASDVDCDDDDPTVYPGARETEGDGLDSNCDGEDPGYAFVGEWTLTSYTAEVAGFDLSGLIDISGDIAIAEDLTATGTLIAADLPMDLAGYANPIPAEQGLNLDLEGSLSGDPAAANLDCAVGDEALDCVGSLLVFGLNATVNVGFE